MHLIVFLIGLLSHEAGLLQLVLKGVHALLIGQGTVLKNLASTARVSDTSLCVDLFRFRHGAPIHPYMCQIIIDFFKYISLYHSRTY